MSLLIGAGRVTDSPGVWVTRSDIAEVIAGAFDGRAPTRGELVKYAGDQGAAVDVIAVLLRLPDSRFSAMRELWVHLAELPVDRHA